MSEEIIIHCKYDELVNIEDINVYEKNPNDHGSDQIEMLAEQYRYQGVRLPIIVCKDRGVIAAGHGRKLAAIRAGMKVFPVVYQSFTNDDQFYAFVVSDNATALWADLKLEKINANIENMGPDFNIEHFGLKDFTLDISEKDIEKPKIKQPKICPECGHEF